jgi:hypothetical protein
MNWEYTNYIQLFLFSSNSIESSFNTNGPYSVNAEINDEHPGPPCNHNITGFSSADSIDG